MKRISTSLASVLLVISMVCPAFGQSDGKNQKLMAAAAEQGTKVPTDLRVNANVNAQAVLIPRVNVNRIFGKEIANNYAVIQLIVGNKSSDAALIVHGIFIDYTRWALSGTVTNAPSVTADGVLRERVDKFQVSTESNQIASEEYRVVRGQLLDAQMWSKRNWTVRLLTFAGSLAGAYAFSIKEKGFLKGIDAFSGVVVPGVAQLWPDGTVEQLNRVSDFGYQANKVIPQQGSEIIVCFFPIDRFLTPGFRRLFLKSPALFFAPLQMLVDTTIENDVKAVLGQNFGLDAEITELRKLLPCYLAIQTARLSSIRTANASKAANAKPGDQKPGSADILGNSLVEGCLSKFGLTKVANGIQVTDAKEFKNFLVLDYLSQMSLNNVKVVVDGVMTLDTTAISAKIDRIEFDKAGDCNDKSPCFWEADTAGGVRTGKIHGSYLTGGQVKIKEAKAWDIEDVTTSTEGSSDQVLNFSFKLTKDIPLGTNLNFVVSKPLPGTSSDAENPKTKDSPPFEYQASPGPSTMKIDKVELDSDQSKVTVTGSGFEDSSLVVTLQPPSGDDITVDKPDATATSLVFDIPGDTRPTGCWKVKIKAAKRVVNLEKSFAIVPAPEIDSVAIEDGNIVITGKNLVDTSTCNGKKLTFNFVNGAQQSKQLVGATTKTSGKWVFPQQAKVGIGKADGTLQVLLDTEVKDSETVTPKPKAAKATNPAKPVKATKKKPA